MGKHSRCVIGTCDNDMQYPELHTKRSNVDGAIIMHKLRKDGTVKAAWVSTILEGRKQLIQESFHTFVMASLLGWLINSNSMFNKFNPSPASTECF